MKQHLWGFVLGILGVAAVIISLLLRDIKRSQTQIRDKEAARIELEENQKALSDALAAAEQANRAKTTFLNNMSHDIRTPMNAIVGFTALAASHMDNPEQVKDYLQKISVSSQHLLSLINDVLDMSRIESGKVTIEESDVHLPDVIHDLRTIIQANVTAKQQELLIDTQDVKHEDIITDKLRLNQVLLNILSNALKFTPAGGKITVSLKNIKGKAVITVGDNGIGMSEETLKRIFEKFYQGDKSRSGAGNGLGLPLAKKIVDLHRGDISAESREGEGSVFTVRLPL
jgi:signal transduction histidine kinase